MRVRARSDDDGAVLILVLILITVVAMGVTVLLSLTDTALRSTVALRSSTTSSADADGAVQAAVATLRPSSFRGLTGEKCFNGGTSDTMTVAGLSGGSSALVNCKADPDSRVMIRCTSQGHCNRPGNAILTLGDITGEDGVHIEQPNNSPFNVHGNVFSGSNIKVVNGSLVTNAAVYARRTCSGTIVSTPAAQCSYGATNALGDDPNYQPAASTVPAYQKVPDCSTANANSVIRFSPGYYDDAQALNDMMSSSSKCKDSTWWFTPGVYYFDFHNDSKIANSNPVLGGGSDIWTVDNGTLVAGTPVNASGKVISTPSVPAAVPGACDNPISDPSATGVQFIFGGDSQLVVDHGQAEICGSYSRDTAPVAVYGLSAGTDSSPTPASLPVTSVSSVGTFGSGPSVVGNLSAVDAGTDATKVASWISPANKSVGTLTVGDFVTAIPAGSALTRAQVRVVHRHADTNTSDKFTIGVTPTNQKTLHPASVSIAGHRGNGAWQDDSVDLDVADKDPDAIGSMVHTGSYQGAKITISTTLDKNDVEDIDAIQLILTYVAPAYRAGAGCVSPVNGPYTGKPGPSCAVLKSTGSPNNLLYVQGTTYTPKAVVDITLNNATEQVFRFGVVARAVWITETGSFSFTGPVIEVPDDAPGTGIAIYLSAYLCGDVTKCDPALAAKVVLIDDPNNSSNSARHVAVLSWSGPDAISP